MWEMLGTKSELPTRKLALRELEARLATVNNPCLPGSAVSEVQRLCREMGDHRSSKPETLDSAADQIPAEEAPGARAGRDRSEELHR